MVFDCPVCGHKTNIPQTNADRIRAMSDEELVEELRHLMIYPLKGKILDWLRQPVKDGDNA